MAEGIDESLVFSSHDFHRVSSNGDPRREWAKSSEAIGGQTCAFTLERATKSKKGQKRCVNPKGSG